MLFNSWAFVCFLPLVLLAYGLLRRSYTWQNRLLLVSSYVFYGWWDVRFLFLVVVSTVIDYVSALMIDRGRVERRKRGAASAVLIGGAFLFVTVDWSALHLWRQGNVPRVAIDWATLLPTDLWRWAPTLGAIALAGVGNALYPRFERWSQEARKKRFLTLSIATNLGLLAVFKYFNFFADNFRQLAETLFDVTPSAWTLEIVLPVGISFYTFQTMSYTIDVARGNMRSTDRLTEFATYVAFFPQLVAGPIERAKHLLPQFLGPRAKLTRSALRSALWLIAWGFYKKLVIADNMGVVVNDVFGPYDSMSVTGAPEDGLRLLFGVYAFAFQIYGDFSGYTDIARGTARLLGFDILLNFRLPYFATSPSDFWRRWHISLSSWLRDYLYISLGGNRGGTYRTYRNLFLTMLLGGLWHGAAWTFVIWGAFHGGLLVAYRLVGLEGDQEHRSPLAKFGLILVMFHFTCLGWLIFRARNVETIELFVQGILTSPSGSPEAWQVLSTIAKFTWFLVLFQILQARTKTLDPMSRWPWFVRLNVWVFVLVSLLALSSAEAQEFLYFAF